MKRQQKNFENYRIRFNNKFGTISELASSLIHNNLAKPFDIAKLDFGGTESGNIDSSVL